MGTQFLWCIQNMFRKLSWEKDEIIFFCARMRNCDGYSHYKCKSFATGKWTFQFKICNKVSYIRWYSKVVFTIIWRILVDRFFDPSILRILFRTISFSNQVKKKKKKYPIAGTCTIYVEGEDWRSHRDGRCMRCMYACNHFLTVFTQWWAHQEIQQSNTISHYKWMLFSSVQCSACFYFYFHFISNNKNIISLKKKKYIPRPQTHGRRYMQQKNNE